jgi:hypothetical protein
MLMLIVALGGLRFGAFERNAASTDQPLFPRRPQPAAPKYIAICALFA